MLMLACLRLLLDGRNDRRLENSQRVIGEPIGPARVLQARDWLHRPWQLHWTEQRMGDEIMVALDASEKQRLAEVPMIVISCQRIGLGNVNLSVRHSVTQLSRHHRNSLCCLGSETDMNSADDKPFMCIDVPKKWQRNGRQRNVFGVGSWSAEYCFRTGSAPDSSANHSSA
jgi:hypothetical protein